MKEFVAKFTHWVCENYESPFVVEDVVFWDLKNDPWKEPFTTQELYDIFIDQNK